MPVREFSLLQYKDKMLREENFILFFGRISKYKGLETLITAESLLDRKLNAKFVIAGADSMGDKLANYAKFIKNQENFTLINRSLSSREKAALFQKAAIIVLPYNDASQSGMPLTAYEFRKPVIVTHTGALPEYVMPGETGLIVPPRNPRALANALTHLLISPSLRRKMGLIGFKKLRNEFSWKRIATKTRKVYDASS